MTGYSSGLPRLWAFIAFLFMALAVIGGGALRSYASKSDPVTIAEAAKSDDNYITLARGMADVVSVKGNVSDIMVANPSVADVTALQSNRLYVVGVNYGTTNVIALDAEGNVIGRMTVHVKIDDVAIQKMVDKLFPDEEVHVTAAADQVILTGHVSTPEMSQRVANLVAQYVSEVQDTDGAVDELIANLLTVSGEQQVMLRVKVIEASRQVLRELGIETNYLESGGIANLTGSLLTDAANGLTADPLGVANVIYNTGPTGFGPLQLIIRSLESEGLINTLAEPNLTAISGEQAGFLAGGEFPIPTSRDRDGNIVVSYRPFGVALNFRPTVLSPDRISLQLQTEVSSISNQNSLDVNELSIPGFAVRRAETTVEMGSGGSLMIAGLLQSEVAKNLSHLPGIKDIPILGKLISSDSFQRQETELVVIVTAYLVRPYGDKKNNVKEVPEAEGKPLAKAFANNIRQTYAKRDLDPELFNQDEDYGYVLQ